MNRALERKPSYSDRKEPFLMAHQHSFSRDAGPLGLLIGEQRMSRRAILRKLAGLTLAGGSITSFITSCGLPTNLSPASQTSTGSPTNPPSVLRTSTSSSLRTALYTYRGHSAGVMGVAWSPDGKRIASGSDDDTVQVWDAANGGHVYTYRRHADAVWGVAWSPDGKRIVSGSGNIDTGRGDTTATVSPPPLGFKTGREAYHLIRLFNRLAVVIRTSGC